VGETLEHWLGRGVLVAISLASLEIVHGGRSTRPLNKVEINLCRGMYKLLASFVVDDDGHPGRYRERQHRPARSQGRDDSVADGQPSSQGPGAQNAEWSFRRKEEGCEDETISQRRHRHEAAGGRWSGERWGDGKRMPAPAAGVDTGGRRRRR